MLLSTPERCIRHAERCESHAATCTHPETREVWLQLAKRWRALAGNVPKPPGSERVDWELAISEP